MNASVLSKIATEWITGAGSKALVAYDRVVGGAYDEAVRGVAERVLNALGPSVWAAAHDPWMPRALYNKLSKIYFGLWVRVKDDLIAETMQSFGWTAPTLHKQLRQKL